MKGAIFAALAVIGIVLGAISMGNPAHATDQSGSSQRNTGWIGSSGNG